MDETSSQDGALAMGGIGSGSRYRRDRKTTIDDVISIDIRYFRKQGLMRWPGCTRDLSWSRGGKQTGAIRYRMEQDRMVLMYRYRIHADEWQDIEENVWLDRTPCNYGGERLWFLCPHCGKRVAVIYGAGVRFLCRHCSDLPYGSQNETYMDRMLRKTRNLRERMGASYNLLEPIWEKPKGMHWKTFERLLRAEAEAHQAFTLAMVDHQRMYKRAGYL